MKKRKLFNHSHISDRVCRTQAEPDALQSEKYIYDCPGCGRSSGPWNSDEAPVSRPCFDCGINVTRKSYEPLYRVSVFGDIPEHYSIDFDGRVKSKKHLRELQATHGTQDYEPVRGPAEGWK